MSAITPTVGRKVWFYWSNQQDQPWDATVIKVFGNTARAAVNLDVVNPETGEHTFHSSIIVGDENTVWPHYRWMPYQQAQAAAASMHPAVAAAHPVNPPGV